MQSERMQGERMQGERGGGAAGCKGKGQGSRAEGERCHAYRTGRGTAMICEGYAVGAEWGYGARGRRRHACSMHGAPGCALSPVAALSERKRRPAPAFG